MTDVKRISTMSKAEVQFRTSKLFQRLVAGIVVFAVFVDIMGSCLIFPAMASLCAYADGGPVDTIMAMDLPELAKQQLIQQKISPHAFNGEKGAWSGRPPVPFSLAMNLVMSAGMLGSAAGSMLFGRLCDKVGCKIPMQICLFMGVFGYIIIYASGIWAKSYYLFAIGFFWNSFFGNTAGVAQVYFGNLFSGAERDMYLGLVMAMAMLGGTVGALVVMPFTLNPENGENYFNAVWLGLGLTLLVGVIVSVVLVEPEKKEKKQMDPKETPRLAKRLLWMTIIASALDSAGDEGTRMARGTIMSALFPEWSTVSRQNFLLMAMIGVAMLCGIILAATKPVVGLPTLAVLGCAATLITQIILSLDGIEAGPYIGIWHCGKLFGFLSTFASGFMIQAVAPKELLGYWSGRNEALTNLAQAVAPLIFASVYDAVGNTRGSEMLYATAVISALATFAYLPTVRLFPKESKEKEVLVKDLAEYEKLTDVEWSQLPLEITDRVVEKQVKAGKQPRIVSWGNYEQERALLPGLQHRAYADFSYLKDNLTRLLADRAAMEEEQENFKSFQGVMPKIDRQKAKDEMGAWIADYFDDAGYIHWELYAQVYKSMLMTAFPPIDDLNNRKLDVATIPIDQWERNLAKVLGVMDSLLASEQRRLGGVEGATFEYFTSYLRRR